MQFGHSRTFINTTRFVDRVQADYYDRYDYNDYYDYYYDYYWNSYDDDYDDDDDYFSCDYYDDYLRAYAPIGIVATM